MSNGPLAARFGPPPVVTPQAGVATHVPIEVENAGSIRWRRGIRVAYHWLDRRDNPIVWDGRRTQAPFLEPNERAVVEVLVRAPIPPGPYRLAFDVVAEHRAWFSELGSPMLTLDLEVAPRADRGTAELPPNVETTPAWEEQTARAHADGYAVVAGSIEWVGGVLHPRPRALAAYAPGSGRVPQFGEPLICPSVVPGVALERLDDIAGLPAYAAPRDEPWIYEGRAVLRARPRSGRRPT
jgi:hypothetical protein